jgi:MamI restriction endonuclease
MYLQVGAGRPARCWRTADHDATVRRGQRPGAGIGRHLGFVCDRLALGNPRKRRSERMLVRAPLLGWLAEWDPSEMKPEVLETLAANVVERRRRLQRLTPEQKKLLLETLIGDFFVVQRAGLLKWNALTGQSAQIDTGYIAQHMASVLLGEPGQGFKGKGLDLADGSEVKSAAILSGVDRPRWNHDLGKPEDDAGRISRGLQPKWKVYLSSPRVFYVLFDRSPSEPIRLRVRAWCIDAQRDRAWRELVERFVAARVKGQYNLQLHPPIGYDDDIVVNTLGNLDFAAVKVFEVDFEVPANPSDRLDLRWLMDPSEDFRTGRTRALSYGGKGSRPSRLEGAAGHVLHDEEVINALFPFLQKEET